MQTTPRCATAALHSVTTGRSRRAIRAGAILLSAGIAFTDAGMQVVENLCFPSDVSVEDVARQLEREPHRVAVVVVGDILSPVEQTWIRVPRMGHAIPASARDLWPDERPLPFGPQLLAYQSLLRAVKEGLRSAGYSPAQLGGCPVEETVTQQYDFRIEEPAGKPERH